MSQTPDAAPPPYLSISPDAALAELDPATGTRDLAEIARACARGRADLVARGHQADGGKRLRLFSTWEITRYLIPVAPAHFRRVLRANPELPQGRAETEGGARWFTLDEVLRLRAHFAAEGSRAKEYRPYRPAGLPAKICAVANFKGGVGKTSTAAHLAMSAALDGYRVLVVDLDSQGSMTSVFGGRVEDEWGTVFPLIARDYAIGLREENRRRVERGDPPQPLEEMLDTALGKTAADVVQKTHWPNIDLIGAQLNLYWAEFQIPVWRMALRGWKLWDALGNALERDRVLEGYDLVILDTPPALGYLTINGLAAADILLVPLGASFLEFELDRALLRHAALDLRLDRGRREHGGPRPRPAGDPLRVGRGARRHHPLRRRPAGRARQPDAGLPRPHPVALAAGLYRAGRPGRRAGGRHLRGRLPRLQPRHLRPRPPYLRRDLCRLQAAARRQLAPRRDRAPREGDRLMARRRLAPMALPVPEGPAPDGRPDVPRAEHLAPIARVAAEAAGTAALMELSETLARARETGRMVLDLALDAIAPDHLARDRIPAEDAEMATLRESIRAHGQRTPIEVTPLAVSSTGDALPYGLISGWRRLAALKALHAETGEARFATVQALVRRPETAADAYVTMVEENEIRLGLSQYERARVAALATERGVFESEKAALLALFATASRPKRSRIRAFLEIYHALDGTLRFPAALPERLGLALVERLRAGDGPRIAVALATAAPETAEAEQALLARLAQPPRSAATPASAAPAPRRIAPGVTLASRLSGRRLTLTLTGIDPAHAARVEAAIEAAMSFAK